jgi:hypothetical protein
VAIRGKNRSPLSVTFNGIYTEKFATASIAQNEVIATIVDYIALTTQCKIVRCMAVASAYAGAPTLQIVVGVGAVPGSPGSTDTVAVAGTTLFAAPVALTGLSSASGQIIPPANYDVIYPAGTVLSMRAVSGAGVTATGLKVSLNLVPFDQYPQSAWPTF